jgi:hypothetical protein
VAAQRLKDDENEKLRALFTRVKKAAVEYAGVPLA